jgi:hypothetical protein
LIAGRAITDHLTNLLQADNISAQGGQSAW